MKVLVFALVATINLISCNTGSLDYHPSLKNEKIAASPTSVNVVCSKKQYKPKSGSLIASMTPRQLIDELIQVKPSAFGTYEELSDYDDSIEKRIRQTGVKALPILTAYFNKSYQKQSAFGCDETRFVRVKRIAHDIDRFEFRLRGTDKGKQTIDAFERAIKRVEKPGFTKKDLSYYRTMFLNDLKGINHYDSSIQDTFWVRYGIEMSETELVEFSNFLIDLAPTYPSWSETDYIKDYSRINKAGNPRQVHVLKNPGRFYEVYKEFKKTKR